MDSSELPSAVCSNSRSGWFGEVHTGANPREMTEEDSRQTSDTSWQPCACGDKISRLEALYHGLEERLVQLEKERKQHAASDHYKMQETSNSKPPYQKGHRSYQEAFPGEVAQTELQEKELKKQLEERVKDLEARNKELLSKVMSMHEHSENMNDPSRLSAVLHRYEILRVHDWEKLRSSTGCSLKYRTGSSMIKKLFDACEKDIQERTSKIFEVLDISPLSDTTAMNKQGIMQGIRNLFRYSYYQNDTVFYSKIITDPPVKAVWNPQECSKQFLEHVDKKRWEDCTKLSLLWPIMKSGEQVIVKGVVWDEI